MLFEAYCTTDQFASNMLPTVWIHSFKITISGRSEKNNTTSVSILFVVLQVVRWTVPVRDEWNQTQLLHVQGERWQTTGRRTLLRWLLWMCFTQWSRHVIFAGDAITMHFPQSWQAISRFFGGTFYGSRVGGCLFFFSTANSATSAKPVTPFVSQVGVFLYSVWDPDETEEDCNTQKLKTWDLSWPQPDEVVLVWNTRYWFSWRPASRNWPWRGQVLQSVPQVSWCWPFCPFELLHFPTCFCILTSFPGGIIDTVSASIIRWGSTDRVRRWCHVGFMEVCGARTSAKTFWNVNDQHRSSVYPQCSAVLQQRWSWQGHRLRQALDWEETGRVVAASIPARTASVHHNHFILFCGIIHSEQCFMFVDSPNASRSTSVCCTSIPWVLMPSVLIFDDWIVITTEWMKCAWSQLNGWNVRMKKEPQHVWFEMKQRDLCCESKAFHRTCQNGASSSVDFCVCDWHFLSINLFFQSLLCGHSPVDYFWVRDVAHRSVVVCFGLFCFFHPWTLSRKVPHPILTMW